ncbi:malectin domain-containing carbohydrate-binding protein [Mucilaginibacter sp. RS28]|uniref:Malectin domain-containing carbohydrate-binding protein n=1 Tax=Mucilaginibacter straminoryzae TaxID=2932774 RepID=A0A9X1X282_9SPHI|nr:glycoside hydrolase family 2 TIM barrel-domain containing protein [Mucilaginibacter straminoryzae]MCJ8209000.1 malectin domain-containing carbohydrate-binding protein [Mucilaginibacter straminoryzae]
MIKKLLLTALMPLLCARLSFAQTRIVQSINSNWLFHKDIPGSADATSWERVSLPHTWNTQDVNDDEPGYYRGKGIYKKTIYIPANWKDKNIDLYFEGANQVTQVFVNGVFAGRHIGGYTAFSIPVSKLLKFSSDTVSANQIMVEVDNSADPGVPPLSADFTFYGGIYRNVFLVATGRPHLDVSGPGQAGLRISTPRVNEQMAVIITNTKVKELKDRSAYKIINEIVDRDGRSVDRIEQKLDGEGVSVKQALSKPHLWSCDDPYLYRVITRLINNKTKEVVDQQTNSLGIRWFKFSADSGFFLNGKHVKLIGANRHQDFRDMGNALPEALQERDIVLLKNMGANFIRIAHYPQAPSILQACDRLGIIASVEIPVVNEINESETFYKNCLDMQREMIDQNFNHPSVVIWAYMNEVLLHPHYKEGSKERQLYFGNIVKLAKRIDSLSKAEDPARFTMIPCNGNFDLYNNTGLTKVPQIVGWNIYSGWYSGGLEGFERFLERHHANLPDKPLIVTEFGADADIRSHSSDPVRFDKTIEYQRIYHMHDLKEIMARPFVAGAAVWNLVDFNSEGRGESTPHINTKGLTTDAREPKEAYFLYQANLLKVPFLKLGGNQWLLRSGIASADGTSMQEVVVFTNQPFVALWLNGKLLKKVEAKDHIAVFQVPFRNGLNYIKASDGKGLEDDQTVKFKMIASDLAHDTTFDALNVSLGDPRFFVDQKMQQVWLPEKPYTKGSWGYLGGQVFRLNSLNRQPFGSDKAIVNTNNDAIYETQRIGLTGFKADVPDGEYAVTLHFAELQAKNNAEKSIYNLDATVAKEVEQTRSFDVQINGKTILEDLSNHNYLLPATAYYSTTIITAEKGQGITIDFIPHQGQAILNAVQIKKIF